MKSTSYPLPLELAENIRSVNPWWTGGKTLQAPAFRRWPFTRLLRSLEQGLAPVTDPRIIPLSLSSFLWAR